MILEIQRLKAARKIVNYINHNPKFRIIEIQQHSSYSNMGALLLDIILQPGMNYNNVVRPRVIRFIDSFPNVTTSSAVLTICDKYGVESVMNWNHSVKVERFLTTLNFLVDNKIETCSELKKFLILGSNQKMFLNLPGIGLKTLDYCLKLLGVDEIAIDRHVIHFVEKAEVKHQNYFETKQILKITSDLLNISSASLDTCIWQYQIRLRDNPLL